MTNEQIVDLYEELTEISQNKDLKFKATTSFALAKNKNLIEPFYNAVIEARSKLIEKYGEKQEDGWLIPNERLSAFKIEFESLMFTKNYIALDQILITDLDDEKLGLASMERLLPIFKKEAG